ncbi:MAG: haloalkane dehalogenase, partial [Bradyrhizobium sp.]|nr:haloalkane dehalogenase [Bradyrhizobium sp.]
MNANRLIEEWRRQGRVLEVEGANTILWRMGQGETVICVHGVPTSGFLYRKLLPELASRGLEGVTLDLPGLGLAGRPADFDYSWSGLVAWYLKAIDAAGIRHFHLVVHDIGGPNRRIDQRVEQFYGIAVFVKLLYLDIRTESQRILLPAWAAWVDRRCTMHPLSSLETPARLTGACDGVASIGYILASGWNGPFRQFYRPACPPPSETSIIQEQEHFLRGFPRLVDDLGFRRLAQAQQHLVEDAGLQQSGKHLGCGVLVAHPPALALRPQIEIAGEHGVACAGRLFMVAPAQFGKTMRIAGNDAIERQLIARQHMT